MTSRIIFYALLHLSSFFFSFPLHHFYSFTLFHLILSLSLSLTSSPLLLIPEGGKKKLPAKERIQLFIVDEVANSSESGEGEDGERNY